MVSLLGPEIVSHPGPQFTEAITARLQGFASYDNASAGAHPAYGDTPAMTTPASSTPSRHPSETAHGDRQRLRRE